MKKKYFQFGILIIIVLVLLFVYKNLDIPRANLVEIKVSYLDYEEEYVFREKENIDKLLTLEKEARGFEIEKGVLSDASDIKLEFIYSNGIKFEKVFKDIYTNFFDEVYNSVEARKQRLYLLYADFSNLDKLILNVNSYKNNNSIEIKDKEIIDEIILGLQEYYLSEELQNPELDFGVPTSIRVEIEDIGYVAQIASNNDKVLNVLKKEGLYKELVITSSDIKEMYIIKGNSTVEVTDKKLMDIALENCVSGSQPKSVIFLKAIVHNSVYDSKERNMYCSFLENKVPKEIEALFE